MQLTMKFFYLIILLLACNSCKTQITAYEEKVYVLLNDVYARNPKAPYVSEDAYFDINHSLGSSELFLESDLFIELMDDANERYHFKKEPSLLFDKKNWKREQPLVSNNKFDPDKIIIGNIHFKNPEKEDVSQHTFFSKINTILFYEEFAIIVNKLGDSLFFARLYVLKDGKYKDSGSASYPPSADE
ncbi:hypothetical protein [Nonlabens sp. Asnod3-A02]|uniref:hypothetical protein n=1 Tax=Nonlabens sp. Asnod3-A02 TaxID=3160579 RepID=UPI0038660B08